MNDAKLCNTCGRPIEEDGLGGLCASCTYGWLVSDIGLAPQPAPLNESRALLNIPGYEIREEIARGGMGIVYRARQKDPQRTVALKMLLPHQVASPEMVGRFRLEARAIAALEHPAILPVHHVGEHKGLPFFTMKFATGGTLAQRREQFEGNWRAIAELIVTLAEAVHFAHERGVLHRDLKPGNVLFDEQDRAYVSDFGLAKVVGDDSGLTRSVDFLGTPHYVAPEVAARSAREATTSSDVYALGAILYELMAGRPPFEAEGMPALLKKIAEEEPLPPSRCDKWRVTSDESKQPASPVPRQIPRDLEVVCLKCLAKEPARRYTSSLDLANDLRRWLAGKPILARETGALERIWLWSRRHRITAALIGAVLVLLIALITGLSVAAVRVADSRRAALRTVEALESQKVNDLLSAGNTAEAIALAARRVRENPDNWADTARLMWALQRRRWAVPVRAPFHPFESAGTNAAQRTVLVRDHDGRLLAFFIGTNVVGRDVLTGTNRYVWAPPFPPHSFGVAEQPGIMFLVNRNGQGRFFEYRTGRMRLPEVFGTSPSSVWLDANGQRAFLIAPDRSGQLVNLQTGDSRTLVPTRTNSSGVSADLLGSFFPDGQRLAVSDGEHTVSIFDSESGVPTGRTFTAPQHVWGLSISPDGKVIVTLTADGTQFWDAESGRELPSRSEVGVSFRPGAFRPGSSRFYQGGNPFGLAIFDPLKGELMNLPARGALLNGHCYADPDSRRVGVRFDRFAGIYEGETGQPLCEPLPVALSLATAPRFALDLCVTLLRDDKLIVWQVKTNRLEPIVLRHAAAVQSARFSPDGQRVITASHDGTARIWDANTGQALAAPLAHGHKVWSACFSPDGRRVATASWDASARLWDAATGEPLSPPLRAQSFVFHVQFSPDGGRLLACGEGGIVRTYEVATGRLLFELKENSSVYWANFSPDGRMIVTRPMSDNPKLFSAETGERLLELNEPGPHQLSLGVVTRGEFSRDGSWLVLGSPARYATVWRLPEGKLHAVLNHVAVVRSASLSPDARTILTTADDMAGQLWDLKTGKALSSPLAGPRSAGAPPNTGNSLRAAAIHPDGRRAITGGSDAAARLWDLRKGFPLGEPAEFGGSVMHAEFSGDGKRVLVACFDGTAHIMPLPPVVERAPAWLAPLAEALVGQRFDSRGAVEPVPPAALWELCEQLRRAPPSDEAAVWARKVLDL